MSFVLRKQNGLRPTCKDFVWGGGSLLPALQQAVGLGVWTPAKLSQGPGASTTLTKIRDFFE